MHFSDPFSPRQYRSAEYGRLSICGSVFFFFNLLLFLFLLCVLSFEACGFGLSMLPAKMFIVGRLLKLFSNF